MLTLVQRDATQLDEARALLHFVESARPLLWPPIQFLTLLLAGVVLIVGGAACGALLIGAAVALALCRVGPRWWPGRR